MTMKKYIKSIVKDINGQTVRKINGKEYIIIELLILKGIIPTANYCLVETKFLNDNFNEINLEKIRLFSE